jgi:hypothetical protein
MGAGPISEPTGSALQPDVATASTSQATMEMSTESEAIAEGTRGARTAPVRALDLEFIGAAMAS